MTAWHTDHNCLLKGKLMNVCEHYKSKVSWHEGLDQVAQ